MSSAHDTDDDVLDGDEFEDHDVDFEDDEKIDELDFEGAQTTQIEGMIPLEEEDDADSDDKIA